MKINDDCIRAILIYLQVNLELVQSKKGGIKFQSISLKEIVEDLNEEFSMEDIWYYI